MKALVNVRFTDSHARVMVRHRDGVGAATRCSGSVCTAAGCGVYSTLARMCIIGLMNSHVCFDWQEQMARWQGFVSGQSGYSPVASLQIPAPFLAQA